MIRYAFLDHFYLDAIATVHNYMQIPFKVAKDKKHERFPGKFILEKLKESKYLNEDFHFYTPDEYYKKLTNDEGKPRGNIFRNEIDLVFWNQRYYLQKWFPDFDPSLYAQKDDYPYDIDHIIADSHFVMSGKGRSNDINKDFWYMRDNFKNCSGNFRLWPKNLNRSDQADNLWRKFILGKKENIIPDEIIGGKNLSYLKKSPFNFSTVGEIREASAIPEDVKNLKNWELACNSKESFSFKNKSTWSNDNDWSNKKRINAFIDATKERRMKLYSNLYETLKFHEWK